MTVQIPETESRSQVGLDHVGLYASSLDLIAASYARLGFRLTPLSQHSGTHAVTKEVVKSGIANRCAMLRHGYIELLGVVDPTLDLRGIPDGLSRYAGMHILAFATDTPQTVIGALRERGFSAAPGVLQRYIGTPGGPALARFTQVRIPREEMPEGLVLTLRHETPELLWQESCLAHPNGALALVEAAVVVDDLDAVVERYARYLGCVPCRTQHQARFALGFGSLLVLDRAGMRARFPGTSVPVLPFMAGFTVEVADIGRTAALLSLNRVPYRMDGAGLQVDAEQAGGAYLMFRQATPERT